VPVADLVLAENSDEALAVLALHDSVVSSLVLVQAKTRLAAMAQQSDLVQQLVIG